MPGRKTIRIIFRQCKFNLVSYLEKNHIFKSIFDNPLWKGVFILGTGSFLAQIIGILTILIITRLYTPTDFGLFGIFSAIVAIIMTFISFRYEFAIPVPKDSEKAANLLVLCILLVFLTSIVSFIFLILFEGYIVTTFNLQTIAPFFGLILIGCFGAGIYQALNYWAIRKKDYTTITYTQLTQSISGSISKIFLGIFGIGTLGLIFGDIILHFTGVGTFIKKIRLYDRDYFKSISFSGLKSVAYEYRDFPIFTTPATLIYTASFQLPIFFLSLYYGMEEVGWYTLAYQALTLPTGLIGYSIAQAFYGEAANQMHINPRALKSLYLNTVKTLILIATPIFVTIALLAPFLFPIIFGDVWLEAGIYALPLTIVAISEFITGPTNKLAIYGFNNWQLGFHIFRFTLIFIGFFISYKLNLDILVSLFLYGCIVAFTSGILFYLNLIAINKIISNHEKIN